MTGGVSPRGISSSRVGFEAELAFPLDDFQARALDALDSGRSVLVAAPTGAGKTVVADYAVAAALASGLKAFYTTPIKALSNQKFHDLRRRYGEAGVGLLTGDNSVNGEAPVVVMTTEVLRNMIYEDSPTLRDLGIVVLDEVHYLQDPYRGAVWEEVIIHLDPVVRLVCLSATVSNTEEFGDWLATARGDTDVVIEEQRPVTLEHLYGVAFRDETELVLLPTFVTKDGTARPNPRGSEHDAVTGGGRRRTPERSGRYRPRPIAPRRADVVAELAARDMLPAIYFIFSRAGCDAAVEQCMAARLRLAPAPERRRLTTIAERHCEGLSDDDLAALGYGAWLGALQAGISSHHAGMVPPMKEAVEEAFQEGLVQVVFATETLALGVNMPARSVVIERLSKFTGETHEPLTPGQYTQLTGRAGRRGIDDLGYGVALWNRFSTFDQIASLASKRTYELTSSFRPTYNMAVNLIRRYTRDDAHHFLNLSFAQYQVDRAVVAAERRSEETRRRLEGARAKMTCDRGDIGEYRRLLDDRDRAVRSGRDQDGRARALARLRPGDLIEAGRGIGRVVVLQRATGRGSTPRVTALDEGGRTVRLNAGSFRVPPAAVGRVRLPEPYRPKQAAFRRETARRLRKAPKVDVPVTAVRPGRADALDQQVADHPVTACPDLTAHLEAARRVDRLERELGRPPGGASRAETLSSRLDRVIELLEHRGYVEGWTLTPGGLILSRIYNEADLLLAECVRSGVFDGLAPSEVAAVASLFTFETRGPEDPPRPRWPSAQVSARARQVGEIWRHLREDERRYDLPESRAPDGGFAETAHAWASGRHLDDLLDDEEDLTGGDFVRNVKQLIDVLRQLADVAPGADAGGDFRAAADALFRGVVEASARVEG